MHAVKTIHIDIPIDPYRLMLTKLSKIVSNSLPRLVIDARFRRSGAAGPGACQGNISNGL
jgi:hypothetical protein